MQWVVRLTHHLPTKMFCNFATQKMRELTKRLQHRQLSSSRSWPEARQEAGRWNAHAAICVHRLNLAGHLVGLAGDDCRLGEHSGGCSRTDNSSVTATAGFAEQEHINLPAAGSWGTEPMQLTDGVRQVLSQGAKRALSGHLITQYICS